MIRLRLIGDVVLTTPIIRALRRARPDAHLSYLVEPLAAPVVAHNPHLDDIIVAPLSRGAARFMQDAALGWQLRRRGYDAVLDFHGGPRSSWLALASGAPVRIGYAVAGRGWMYTQQVPRPRNHRPRHSVENQWDVADALMPNLPRPTPSADPVEMPEDTAATAALRARLAASGIDESTEAIVMHVGAGNEFRRWPEQSFAEVGAALVSARPNRRIILTTGAAQAASAAAVAAGMAALGATARTYITMCDLDLASVRSLMGLASLFVGGDSGPAHIAATTKVPMVVIFGPTTPSVWGPWRPPSLVAEHVQVDVPCRPCDQRRCGPGDLRCLTWSGSDAVVAAAERALARVGAAGAS
ncbi:MAG: glycosyltransferase family 9 protein [Acidobacteriota bacterium]